MRFQTKHFPPVEPKSGTGAEAVRGLATFGMEIVLNRRLASEPEKKFAFVEREPDEPFDDEPGLTAFLQDTSLSGDVTEAEIAFLRHLRFQGKRPTPLYYYRALQNFRGPLHFHTP